MSVHNITIPSGTSVRLPTAGKYCDRDIIATAEVGGCNVQLPTYTVEVYDNDCAEVTVTTIDYVDGKLTFKSTEIPVGGYATVTAAWRTPIFITEKYLTQPPYVFDGDHDELECDIKTDLTNNTFVIDCNIDRGDKYYIDLWL